MLHVGEQTPFTPRYTALLQERRRQLRAAISRELPPGRDFVLELGCGHGHFLTAYAKKHPDRFCVGLDLVGERIARATRKRQRAQLENLSFLHAEAHLFLDVLSTEVHFTDVHALFPDPWPKARHHKHRIIQPAFLTRLAPRMADGARLFFRTDFAPYFLDAQQAIRDHPRWFISDCVWEFEYETVFQRRAESYQSLIAQVRLSA